MLKPSQAQAILDRTGASGSDFHALSSRVVDALLAEADTLGYRKPRGANGSRGRYFHAYLERRASSLTHMAREYVANDGRSCSVTLRRGGRSVSASSW